MNDIIPVEPNRILKLLQDAGVPLPKREEPLLTLRERHHARVISTRMNHNDSLMLSGGEDNVVILSNLANKDVDTFKQHLFPVCAVAFLDANRAVSIGLDSTLIVWDLNKKTSIFSEKIFEAEEDITPVCCLSQNGELASFCMGNRVKVYNVQKRQVTLEISRFENISCMSFGDSNRSLVIGCHDEGIYVVDLQKNTDRRIHTGEGIYSIDASSSGELLIAAGTYSGRLKLYKNFELVRSEELFPHCIFSVSVNANHQQVFAGGIGKVAGVNLSFPDVDMFLCSGSVHSLFLSASGKYCVAGIDDGTIDVINIQEKRKQFVNVSNQQISAVGYDSKNQRILFGSNLHKIWGWDLKSGRLRVFEQHTGGVNCLATDPDQDVFVSGGADRCVYIWDSITGKVAQAFSISEDWVTSAYMRSQADLLCVASLDNTVKIINISSGNVIGQYEHEKVTSVTACPETNMVYSGGNQSIKAYDLVRKRERVIVSVEGIVNALAVDPANNLLVSGSSNQQIRVGTMQGDRITTYACGSSICSLVIERKSSILIAGGSQGEIYLIDQKVNQIRKVQAHPGGKVWVTLINEKGDFLSAGNDGFIKFWNISGQEPVLSLLIAGGDFIVFSQNYIYWSSNPDAFIEFYDSVEKKYLKGLDYESYKLQYHDKTEIKALIHQIVAEP